MEATTPRPGPSPVPPTQQPAAQQPAAQQLAAQQLPRAVPRPAPLPMSGRVVHLSPTAVGSPIRLINAVRVIFAPSNRHGALDSAYGEAHAAQEGANAFLQGLQLCAPISDLAAKPNSYTNKLIKENVATLAGHREKVSNTLANLSHELNATGRTNIRDASLFALEKELTQTRDYLTDLVGIGKDQTYQAIPLHLTKSAGHYGPQIAKHFKEEVRKVYLNAAQNKAISPLHLVQLANIGTPSGIYQFLAEASVESDSIVNEVRAVLAHLYADDEFIKEMAKYSRLYPTLMKRTLPSALVDSSAPFPLQQELYRREALLAKMEQDPHAFIQKHLQESIINRVKRGVSALSIARMNAEDAYRTIDALLTTEFAILERISTLRDEKDKVRGKILALHYLCSLPVIEPLLIHMKEANRRSVIQVGQSAPFRSEALVRQVKLGRLLERLARNEAEQFMIGKLFERVTNPANRSELLAFLYAYPAIPDISLGHLPQLVEKVAKFDAEKQERFIALFEIVATEAIQKAHGPDVAIAWTLTTKPVAFSARVAAFDAFVKQVDHNTLYATVGRELYLHGNKWWRAPKRLENIEERLSQMMHTSLRITSPDVLNNLSGRLTLGKLDYIKEPVQQYVQRAAVKVASSSLLRLAIVGLEGASPQGASPQGALPQERSARVAAQVIRYSLDYVEQWKARPPQTQTESIEAVLGLELAKVGAVCQEIGLSPDEVEATLALVEGPLRQAQSKVSTLFSPMQPSAVLASDLPSDQEELGRLHPILQEIRATEESFQQSFQKLAELSDNPLFMDRVAKTSKQKELVSVAKETEEKIRPFQRALLQTLKDYKERGPAKLADQYSADLTALVQLFYSKEYQDYLLAIGHYINAYYELAASSQEISDGLRALKNLDKEIEGAQGGQKQHLQQIRARLQDPSKLQITDFAIAPVQRLPRLELFLKDLTKLSTSDPLKQMLSKVGTEFKLVNESAKVS